MDSTNNPTPSVVSARSSCFQMSSMDTNPARSVLGEMVGSFLLMICVSGVVASGQVMGGQVSLMDIAAAIGLTVAILTFCFAPISGAHLNPAITLASAIFGHFSWSMVIPYMVAQTIGCVIATYVGMFVYDIKSELLITRPSHHSIISAFSVEILATFILMFVVGSLANQTQSVAQLSGFIIGMAIGLAEFISGPISGGSMNPARSIGPAIVSWAFDDIWIYITAPVIGAIAGAFMSGVLRLQPPPSNPPSSPSNGRLFHRSSSANAYLIT